MPARPVPFREAMRRRGQSFKEALNQAVVRGLADLRCDAEEAPFVPQTFPMGLRAGHDPAYPGSLDGDVEGGTLSLRFPEIPVSTG